MCRSGHENVSDKLPTYSNIIDGFRKIITSAQKGDLVYIHYSGHGVRTLSNFRALKVNNPSDYDEAMVPADIATNEEYVRDVEVACFLRLMVEKELDVFVVFDCCHAGGLHRNCQPTTHIRGLSAVDRFVGTSPGLTGEELDAWKRCNQGESKGYTLLAACDEHEFAREESCGNGGPRGLLTRAMWEKLQEGKNNERFTINEFLRSIVTFVHKRSMYQTPRLKGEGKIAFFHVEHDSSLHATLSPKYPFSENQELEMHAGLAHGILEKMVFAVYPGSQPDFADTTKRLAYAEVRKTELLSSTIKIISLLNPGDESSGNICSAQFMFIAPELKKRIKVSDAEDVTISLKRKIVGNPFMELVAEGADFQVVGKGFRSYDILDSGGCNIPWVLPDKPIEANEVVERITHYAQYSIIRDLRHSDPSLAMQVDLLSVNGTRLSASSGRYEVADQAEVILAVKNNLQRPIHITVFNLSPSLAITQIYPDEFDVCETLAPGQLCYVNELQMNIPGNSPDCIDIIRVFVTFKPRSFRWIQLPAIGEPTSFYHSRGDSEECVSELKELCDALNKDRNVIRKAKPCVWNFMDIEVHTRR